MWQHHTARALLSLDGARAAVKNAEHDGQLLRDAVEDCRQQQQVCVGV